MWRFWFEIIWYFERKIILKIFVGTYLGIIIFFYFKTLQNVNIRIIPIHYSLILGNKFKPTLFIIYKNLIMVIFILFIKCVSLLLFFNNISGTCFF